ncbi:hypothetical protein PFISCL1PPCAC_12920, partial [Pristionchus fissidentatus]
IGVLLNSLLLYLIKRFSRKEMGTYKYLLAIFAAYDIFLSFAHAVANPVRRLMYFFNEEKNAISMPFQNVIRIYFALFSIPFSLLNIHFLYRYWAINEYIMACTIGAEKSDPCLAILQDEFQRLYNFSVEEGWLLMDHWRGDRFNMRTLPVLLPMGIIMVISFSVAFYLLAGTFLGIRRAKTISFSYRSFQLKILVAVCVQTIVPFIFVYIPYFGVTYLPFLRL